MGKLEGKVCLVTGASRGIGKAIAALFAAEGAKVVVSARTVHEGQHPLEGSLDSTVQEIRSAGGEIHAVAADIAEHQQCLDLIDAARQQYGPVDVLVNNAAITYLIPIASYPIEKWHRSMAVNLHAPFYLSQEVLKDMMPRGSGAIVNIGSGAAIGPGRGPYNKAEQRPGENAPGFVLYGIEKAGLERFTQGLACEVYGNGISVTCVSPSLVVPTPGTMHHKLVSGMDDPKGEHPDVMARAALLLATEPIDKVTGRVCYSQQILQEFGWMTNGRGRGVDSRGSGFSEI